MAQVAWVDVEPALSAGRIARGSRGVWPPHAAASIAEGQPIDLGDLAPT